MQGTKMAFVPEQLTKGVQITSRSPDWGQVIEKGKPLFPLRGIVQLNFQ
jgi:hypothetical protein